MPSSLTRDILKLAFDQNKDGVFKLVSDVSISEALVINNGTITLDLNGKTLTFDKQKAKLRIRYNTNMTVKNGNIKGMDYTLQPEDDSTLTVLSDVNIILDDESITKNKYGIAFWDRATVNFSGNIVVTGDSIGISGSGNLDNTGSLNITGGTIKALDGVGIYFNMVFVIWIFFNHDYIPSCISASCCYFRIYFFATCFKFTIRNF